MIKAQGKPGNILVLALLFFSFCAQAQIIAPPKWTKSLEPTDLSEGQEGTLVLEAEIPAGWYIYANDFDPDLGPLLTTLKLEQSDDFQLIGDLEAVDAKRKYEEVWEGEVNYFMGNGEFEQKIRLNANSGTIKGVIEYQMCSDLTGQCINYEEDLEIPFSFTGTDTQTEPTESSSADGDSPFALEENQVDEPAVAASDEIEVTPVPVDDSLWGFMVLAFLAGLAALLTPCVFPMIPMTVSFFTGRANSKSAGIRNAFIYGFSIIAIYTVAGTAVAAIQGPEFANWLATHWLPNLFFFGIFIFFALAFLGMFEITLPSGLVNKVDEKAEKGGMTGIFFMAFTLVLVSFSCTGPIVGSILISSAGGELIKPILGMFAFLAVIIPGCGGWVLYVFLIPFYASFPMIVLGTSAGLGALITYIIALPVLKLLLGKSDWGQRMMKKFATPSSGRRGWSSGSGWSGGGGGRSSGGFSGGGGSFGGGGSSGSW